MTKKKEAGATPRQYEAAFKAEAVRLWQLTINHYALRVSEISGEAQAPVRGQVVTFDRWRLPIGRTAGANLPSLVASNAQATAGSRGVTSPSLWRARWR